MHKKLYTNNILIWFDKRESLYTKAPQKKILFTKNEEFIGFSDVIKILVNMLTSN